MREPIALRWNCHVGGKRVHSKSICLLKWLEKTYFERDCKGVKSMLRAKLGETRVCGAQEKQSKGSAESETI